MNAEEAREQLSAYLDGELSERERRDLDAIMAADPALRAELEELRQTVSLLRSLPKAKAPAGFAQRVQRAIAAHVPSRRAVPLRWLGPVALAAAACLVIAFAAVLVSGLRTPREAARKAPGTPMTAERKKAAETRSGRPTTLRSSAAGDNAGLRVVGKPPTAHLAETAGPSAKSKVLAKKAVGLGRAEVVRRADQPAQPAPGVVPGQPGAPAFAANAPTAPAPARPAKGGAGRDTLHYGQEGVVQTKQQVAQHLYVAGQPLARAGRRELVEAIVRARKPSESKARPPSVKPEGTLAEMRAAAAIRQKRGFQAGALDISVRYRDLEGVLDRVAETLEGAGVSYVVQPLGGGEFVVEAAPPASLASELARRLAAVGGRAHERQAALEAGEQETGRYAEAAAQQQAPARVRLNVRFAPVAAQGAPAGARQR